LAVTLAAHERAGQTNASTVHGAGAAHALVRHARAVDAVRLLKQVAHKALHVRLAVLHRRTKRNAIALHLVHKSTEELSGRWIGFVAEFDPLLDGEHSTLKESNIATGQTNQSYKNKRPAVLLSPLLWPFEDTS
jgi:hypothetical protein